MFPLEARADTSAFGCSGRVLGEQTTVTMHALNAQSADVSPTSLDGETKWLGHMADDVGATYGPEPMATLSATPERLVLSGTRGTFRIPRNAVKKLSRAKMYPWVFSGLRIQHQVPGYPADLQFKPLGCHWREVQAALKTLGYPVG